MSVIMFANYYLYDSYSTLKIAVQTDLAIDSETYGWIRSFYNMPNIFLAMALVGGIIMDRIGIRRTGFLFTALCAIGGLIQAYGVSPSFRSGGVGYGFMGSFLTDWSPEVKMMVLGRFLFGFGAETQIVMVNKVLAKWFKGKELALAFGLNLAMGRFGSALAMELSPKLAQASATDTALTNWHNALWLGGVIMLSGLVFFICYMIVDFRDEKRFAESQADAGRLAADEEFHLRDIGRLIANKSYLFITLLCATFYAAVFPFQDLLADLLTHTHGYDSVEAGKITSRVPWAAMICTVLFAAFVDRKGKRATLMLGGAILLTACFFLFGFTKVSPWLVVPLFGVAFSLVPAAMWPAVALIVRERYLGTAYGLMTWIQNLCWGGMGPLAGMVLDKTNPDITPEVIKAGTGHYDFTWTMMMFASIGIIAFFCAIGLKAADKGKHGHGLELPSKEAAELNARLEAEAEAEAAGAAPADTVPADTDENGTTP
jgi:MFS family permease